MDIAERKGSVLRRSLRSADRFSDRAISAGSDQVKSRALGPAHRWFWIPLVTRSVLCWPFRRRLCLFRTPVSYRQDCQRALLSQQLQQPLKSFIIEGPDDRS